MRFITLLVILMLYGVLTACQLGSSQDSAPRPTPKPARHGTLPKWMIAKPGQLAYVGSAVWGTGKTAYLIRERSDLVKFFTSGCSADIKTGVRCNTPASALDKPVGVEVRMLKILPDPHPMGFLNEPTPIVKVEALDHSWTAWCSLGALYPLYPTGMIVLVFGGEAAADTTFAKLPKSFYSDVPNFQNFIFPESDYFRVVRFDRRNSLLAVVPQSGKYAGQTIWMDARDPGYPGTLDSYIPETWESEYSQDCHCVALRFYLPAKAKGYSAPNRRPGS